MCGSARAKQEEDSQLHLHEARRGGENLPSSGELFFEGEVTEDIEPDILGYVDEEEGTPEGAGDDIDIHAVGKAESHYRCCRGSVIVSKCEC